MAIAWDTLWQANIAHFALGDDSIHGPDHWRRVERYGLDIARQNGGDLIVVRLFAAFHDVCRQSDGHDHAHGARGAALAAQLRGTLFDMTDEQFALLHEACTGHTSGGCNADPTIGACWDADRLDLWRAGIWPKEQFMSTAHARALVRANRLGPQFVP